MERTKEFTMEIKRLASFDADFHKFLTACNVANQNATLKRDTLTGPGYVPMGVYENTRLVGIILAGDKYKFPMIDTPLVMIHDVIALNMEVTLNITNLFIFKEGMAKNHVGIWSNINANGFLDVWIDEQLESSSPIVTVVRNEVFVKNRFKDFFKGLFK